MGYPQRVLAANRLLQAADGGNSKADAALLDEMINNIQFIPGDFTRAVNDSVKLIAETAPDANNLLRQYVALPANVQPAI